MKKKAVTLALTICMLSTALAGCGGNGSEAKQSAGAEAVPVSGSLEFTGYPMQTDQSLSIWASQLSPSSTVASWEESPFHTGLEEMTGVHMDWTFPTSGTDASQAFNLLLSDAELPDLIWHRVINDAESYIEDGVLRDLTDLLPKYAPNYWKFLQENPYYDKSMKTDNGRYYGFGFFRESRWQSVYHGPMVRKDWLDECGLKVPVTIADWEETMKAFHDKYGAKFAFCPTWRVSPGMAGAFGAYGTIEMALFLKDGKVNVAQAQPEWKEYMTWLNSLYQQGLIDPDVVTLDDATLKTKVANSQVGITNTSMGTLDSYITDAAGSQNGAEWIGCTYPVMNEGDKINAIFCEDPVVEAVVAVSTSCPEEKVELALRWLDYAFTEEGRLYWNFGKEGESYEMVDGVPTFTDLITKNELGINEAVILYTGNSGWGLGVQALGMVQQKLNPVAVEAGDKWFTGNEEATNWVFPTCVTMTPEETQESSTIYNALNTYIKEMSLKFLIGEESLDNWDGFVKTLEDMGLKRMLEIRQTAYERFQAR